MFVIRRVYDDIVPANRSALNDVRRIFGEQFPGADATDIEQLGPRLRNPFAKQFRHILCVAENAKHSVLGFALMLHDPVIGFCYLDYLAAGKRISGRGVGAALYEYIRDEAAGLHARGLFFECLPDDPSRSSDPAYRAKNAARLKFYETYGARPIIGTQYELPVPGGNTDNVPHLVYDDLDTGRPVRRAFAKQVVRAVLERKYGELCPPEYVKQVVDSFRDDPLPLRPWRYRTAPAPHRTAVPRRGEPIVMAVNDRHDIHHIRERGYVESPVRIAAILRELEPTGWMRRVEVTEFPLEKVKAVHSPELVSYLERACNEAPPGKSVYPYVFPVRNRLRPPRDLSVLAGYYCIDTFTPIHRNAFLAAKRAADCVLTVADELLAGTRLGYALVRPPGHHAEYDAFGGFCYFSNAAVGAQHLCQSGRVAIVDIDYHHGNGQQEIFYARSDVLTVSIHGHPEFAYPYFTGFDDERGVGAGEGFNLNLPLPEKITGAEYRDALATALDRVRQFDPTFLVVCLGLDPAKGDPTGTWALTPKDFELNGRTLGSMGLPTLVVQEGGYRTRTLGTNARYFFDGLLKGRDGH